VSSGINRAAVLGKDCLVLIIHIPSVADDQDKDGEDIILDLVDDAVVADANTITGPAFEFL